MDDILSSLSGVSVTKHENNPHAEHPHFALYKAKTTGSSQEERRRTILTARKDARYDLLSHLRSIEEEAAESSDLSDDMDCQEVKQCYSRPRRYRNFVMLSEWLVDVPEDFSSTYLALPCPVGKRCLVVSARGRTRAYSKSGATVNQFPSLLPGGNRQTNHKGYALLDCVYNEANKTFYVLDLVIWLNQSIMESETLFRFEWLKSRILEETPDVQYAGRLNPYRFERVPYYDCSPDTLAGLLNNPLPFSAPLDGILFYHSQTHYTHGPTPLVGWLKAYMFSEILGVSVPDTLLSERPAKYTSLPNHIQYAKDQAEAKKNKMEVSSQGKKKNRSKNKKKSGKKMDVESKEESVGAMESENKLEVEHKVEAEMELSGTLAVEFK